MSELQRLPRVKCSTEYSTAYILFEVITHIHFLQIQLHICLQVYSGLFYLDLGAVVAWLLRK